jgi:hypothetical protein
MKNIIAFILPLVVFIIFANLFVAIKYKPLLQDVCNYRYSLDLLVQADGAEPKINQWQYSTCLYREAFSKLTTLQRYCQRIAKPNCQIEDNDTLLCQGMIRNKMTDKSQEDCELDFACPDLIADYQALMQKCQK